ncbi:N-acetylglucosamine kinase [Gluconobacter potus]|uniref:N-acetylglucosamine kinase n=1 Tax=Gluconobacter potus TaxID=2724927 RepID=A0A149QZ40_9PROT|nr:BadF/BadG/BcrA/BcrD ATPase family protein [Gluconobacter potus]KXV02586.1 N-acetylglucosamine kinase [Gluconobacter potus]
MTQSSIMALDGGGSKTLLVVLRQDGAIADIGRAGGSNPFDQPLWRETLSGLFARLPPETRAAGLGLAGFGESSTLNQRQRALISASLPNIPLYLTNDVDMACTAAFAGQEGVLLLSGTGSMAWATDGQGHHCRVGGWGSLFGDEGSAFWIGRKALGLVTELLDGRNTQDIAFLEPFQKALDLPSDLTRCGPTLLEWYGNLTHERSAVAALARIVARLAEQDCPAAIRMMREAATQLAAHIQTARRKLSRPELPWSYAGGTLQSCFLREAISESCGTSVAPRLPPIGGGLLSAARLAGWSVDADWIDRLAATLEHAGLGN